MKRRTFLQASSLLATTRFAETPVMAQETADGEHRGPTGSVVREYWNDLPNYLAATVDSARVHRKTALSAIKAQDDVLKRTSFVQSTIWELIGGQLEKTPLNASLTGTIERSGYRIEKLIFEAQPQFYVPAHLYIPTSGTGPFPGIISPLGHTADGKAFRSYQILFQNLARKGFVVLTWDPPGQGERLQFLIPGTTRSRFSPTGEHDQFGFPAFLIGSTATQFEIWDGIRAVDYLLTRSEVDGSRIGCCGHSGGGTQTMYLCALEPRIHAAVVVEGHTENVAGANYEPPGAYADAEQNIIGSLKRGLDRGDLLAAFAPKPLLICFTHMDVGATYSPHYERGTREIFQELKDLYSIYGAPQKVGLSASSLPHDYDFFHRRATYDWFNTWLKDHRGDNVEADFDEAPATTLFCTTTGQILTSLGGRNAVQVNRERLQAIQSRRTTDGQQMDKLPEVLREVLAVPRQTATAPNSLLSKINTRNLVIEEFEIRSEPTIRVPGWFVKPAAETARLPVVVILSPAGKNRLFDEVTLLNEVTRQNIAICAIDTRGMGQATPRYPSSGPLFYSRSTAMAYSLVSLAAGVPLIGQRVTDLLCCVDYLSGRDDVNTSHIGLLGSGASGLVALFGAALDRRIRAVLLDRTLTDFASLVASEEYSLGVDSMPFGLLQHFDLPEICAALVPRHLWIRNPVGPTGATLSLSESRARYAYTLNTYANGKNTAHLSIFVESDGLEPRFGDWIKASVA
jgi:cephalosporin-C deacetylase-like acetyl esterase